MPAEYRELKDRNEALTQQIQDLQARYNSYKQKDINLVPSNVVEKHQHQIERAKNYYDQNKNITDKIKKLQS